ncbi:LuxR C-terminal-related transcriptional regulator [Salinibacterium sp. G-O1]|uniref:helix-turn-helix transcriptional regulator n=1 Tax=Salinibacterium sp. G-O1 TaxID=3046208 RepID=UPI0024B923FB|nr:LuxR C-terminal-related transcriptional regulator [Salinibacterium sp. G-O1]MDJ0333785.1 LuxR C-terminal-related transcriptional regulator [Salinibacterium sp. G-O1]
MPHPIRHGIPSFGAVATTSFASAALSSRVHIIHDVPLVPVRAILAASLVSDSSDRDVVWIDFPTPQAQPWETIRAALADAFSLPMTGDPYGAVAHVTRALERPLLLAVSLTSAVRSSVDTGLLDLLASSPHLSIVAICSARRALMARGRIEFGAVTAAPSSLVLNPHEIRETAAAAGILLTESTATGLAQTALAQADVLPAVLAMMEPDAEAGDDSETYAIRMRAETSYVLELRAQTMSTAELQRVASLAIAGTFTHKTLAAMTQGSFDDRDLDRLAQSRVLLRDGRFHLEPTLRRAVLDEAGARIPDVVSELHSALARGLLSSGKGLEALTHFVLAEDWDSLIGAIDDSLVKFIAEDQQALQRIILDLPRAVRDEHPRLSLYIECEWNHGDALARPYLSLSRRTPATLTRMPDVMRSWDRLITYLAKSLVYRLKSDHTGALEAAEELDELLAGDDMIDRPPLVLAEAHYQSGMSRLLGLDLAGARDSFQRSFDLAYGLDDAIRQSSARALEAFALTRALEGEVEQASNLLRSLDDDDNAGSAGLVANALVAISRLDPKGARHWLAQLADMRDNDEFWAFAVHAGNRYGLYWGDPVETDSNLDRAWAEHSDQLVAGSTAQVLLTSDAADLALLLGQLPRAEAALDQSPVRNTWISVCRARLALLAGNPKHALLFILEGQGRGRTERHGQLDLAVLRAASEHALDRKEDAAASLLRAINQSNKSGVIVPFHLLPLETLRSLAELHPDAGAFIARHELRGTSYLAPYQTLAGALSERELVVLRALDPGATIEQVARKLFVASNTVKAQLRSIYRKLNVSTRTEALLVAAELGLLDEDSRSA